MTQKKLGVGIIGLQPNRSWAATGHVPALRALPDLYEIRAVANTSQASADSAAAACDIPKAYGGASGLIADPSVDVVVIAVKVPFHLELTRAAFDAGKAVYCEWPLGNSLAEAEEMASYAREKGLIGVAGIQSMVSPAIAYAARLIRDKSLGEILSTTIVGRGRGWGGSIRTKAVAYTLDKSQGSSMLTVPVGHTLSALRMVLGDVSELSAHLALRRTSALVADSGETLPMTSDDQVLVIGALDGGAPFSLHFRGGESRDGSGFSWEINGTDGELRLTGSSGHTQQTEYELAMGRGDEKGMQRLDVPSEYLVGAPKDSVVGNLVRMYRQLSDDIHTGKRLTPTFEDGVAIHQIIAAIEESGATGKRVNVLHP